MSITQNRQGTWDPPPRLWGWEQAVWEVLGEWGAVQTHRDSPGNKARDFSSLTRVCLGLNWCGSSSRVFHVYLMWFRDVNIM